VSSQAARLRGAPQPLACASGFYGSGSFLAEKRSHVAMGPESAWDQVYKIVERIPKGRVMNYGQIAGMLKRPLSARAVGWALHSCPPGLPWHRVVNAAGRCSSDETGAHPPGLQQALLEAEGIEFGTNGALDLERYRYRITPRSS